MAQTGTRVEYPVSCTNAGCRADLFGPVKFCPFCGKELVALTKISVPPPSTPQPGSDPDPGCGVEGSGPHPDPGCGVEGSGPHPDPGLGVEGSGPDPDPGLGVEGSGPDPDPGLGVEGSGPDPDPGLGVGDSGPDPDPGRGVGSTEPDPDPSLGVGGSGPEPEPGWLYRLAEAAALVLLVVVVAFVMRGKPKSAVPPPVSEVPRPAIQVGDAYTYETINHTNPKRNHTTERKVESVTGDTVHVRTVNKKSGYTRNLYFDREWNFIGSNTDAGDGARFNPPFRYFEFPLKPGKTWSGKSVETKKKTGETRTHKVRGSVGGWERVRVLDKVFDAIKVELNIEMLDGAKRSTSTDTSWYVPEVKRSVKSVIRSRDGDGKEELITVQLVAYRLARSSIAYTPPPQPVNTVPVPMNPPAAHMSSLDP